MKSSTTQHTDPLQATHRVLGGRGAGFAASAGSLFTVVNTHGGQVVDMWALHPDGTTYLSTAHSHTAMGRIVPRVGDVFVDQQRCPMLRLAEDTSPGLHDTLLASCDPQRYRDLGVTGYHRSCEENFHEAANQFGLKGHPVPDPVNLFQHVAIGEGSDLALLPAGADAGARVVFEVLYDLLVIVSACPMDIVPINGVGSSPRDVEVRLN